MRIDYPDELFTPEELRDTPIRVSKFFHEWFTKSKDFKFTTFEKPEGLDQLIIIKDLTFTSMCSHHLLPFMGVCHIGYIPSDKVAGLSKFPRVVDLFSHRPQMQERLTQQICDYLSEKLDPQWLIVVMEAEHTCMSIRGVKKNGSKTVTSAIYGELHTSVKQEFLELIK